ncbi:MAG TPA: FHA domain-containing serine/threonine-protein kinase [Candidatus Methylomirabilis sp.]|nr:FHA domain-containing serine/threonine-protein kinase [Candidatus Methylomirabilis sp.]
MNIVLRVISGPHEGQEYQINRSGSFIVGRASRAAFPMTADLTLSREHFQLENFPPLCHLVDLGSTNGTKVNGLRVERVLLREGDLVAAGGSTFAVHYPGDGGDARLRDTCAGCGVQLENGVPFTSTKPEEVTSVLTAPRSLISSLLCADCEARRQQFPETSPDYLIEEVIGEGGMGTVYRARQISRNRRVAIKMMIANSTAGEKALNYFHREIHALRDMLMPGGKCHPGIVEFYELFQIEGHFQLVMEYVDGKNALDWVRALKQPMPIAAAALIGQDLLSALHFAHSKGYVHRDIKPTNLLVMGPVHRPRVKLSDFGLAKSMVDNSSVFSNLTRQGDVGGSVGFLSPEHIRQFGEVREPADIYCAGATLFYLLTEKYPYLGFDPGRPDSYEMILDHPPVPLRAYRPDAPEGLEQILLKALRKRPHSRWKSAESMWQALRAFLAPGQS